MSFYLKMNIKHYLSFYKNNVLSFRIVDKNDDDAFEISLNHPKENERIALIQVGSNYNTQTLWSKDIDNVLESKKYILKIYSQIYQEAFDLIDLDEDLVSQIKNIEDLDIKVNSNNFYLFILTFNKNQITSMILLNPSY